MSSDTTSESLYLTDISPNDKPWDVHRANSSVVQALYRTVDYSRYAERIQECSLQLGFALEAKDGEEFKLRLREARFCRVRFCPTCQWRRSMMWRARFLATIPKVVAEYPTARWVFLTLTVKNCPIGELRANVQAMNKGWHRLVIRKKFSTLGFVRAMEVTRSTAGDAHPHFHALLMMPSTYYGRGYITQAEFTEMWQSCCKLNYTPIVNVKAVKAREGQNGLVLGILETLKYGVKEDDLMADPEWLAELTRQLHKTRSVTVGGVLKKFISDEEPEDLIHAEGEETLSDEEVKLWFGWREGLKRYAQLGIDTA